METIQVLNDENQKWEVSIGSQALGLLERKGIEGDEKNRILNEACEILGNCGDPKKKENNVTGLAIGYVQSGKTLSFTTVAALASQNGFNIIIIIDGSTTKLVDQTTKRLEGDLEIYSRTDVSWSLFKNPKKNQVNEICGSMEDGIFNETPVLILTVMKNITHLKNLNELFDSNRIKTIKPNVLIIDDEADQASLNTKAKSKLENEVSAIYNSIRNLRSKITKNTYLQYIHLKVLC